MVDQSDVAGLSRSELEAEVLRLRTQDVRTESYRALFEAIDDGLCIIEFFDGPHGPLSDYVHVAANAGYERHTGIAGIVGKTLRDIAPDEAEGWAELYGAVLRTGEPLRFERDFVAAGRYIEVSATRIEPASRHQVLVLFRDISERKRAEAALLELNDTLEQRVAERTTELMQAEDQLRQSQKMEAVGQLTGGVAHDFNNLLTVIRSAADLLRRPDASDERRRRYVDAIADTADRAAKLTRQLLAFSRRQALNPEVFDVGASVADVHAMVGTLVGSRVVLTLEVPDEPCFVRVDRSQLDTAIVNIAANARDAMRGAGTLALSVGTAPRIPALRGHGAIEGSFVTVSVSDSGVGIASDDIARIFEPFYTTKDVGEGTGLGLSQVFGFVKQSGGDVVVESRVGNGSVFTLFLPRVAAPDSPAAEDRGAVTAIPRRDIRILMVEDNPHVGQFSHAMLTDLGYSIVHAENGAAALSELRADAARFDIVFSDVVMPGMSGVELGRAIHERHPGLPVLLTSGYSDILATEGSGGFELLHKPYSLEELSGALHKVLCDHEPGRERPA